MDYQKFIQLLPGLYENWGEESVRPKSDQFQVVLAEVPDRTTPNVMQLLNLAVECMEADEIYCQIGCSRGANAIGALLNHPDRTAYTVDNFSESDPENQEQFSQNLSLFDLDEQLIVCDQNFEEFFFDLREIQPEGKIGVYFYDGLHDYRSQLLALLLVKPFLAERSLIVIHNSNWSAVQQATWDFLAAHPQSQLLLNFPTPREGDYTFGNGIYILAWDIDEKSEYNWDNFGEYFRNQPFIKALREFQMEFELTNKKQIAESLYQEALTLQTSNQLAAAEKKYKEALKWDRNLAKAWHNVGILYYSKQEYENALAMLLEALHIDAAVAQYHYSLGLVLEKIGKTVDAIRAYERAIARNPDLTDAYNNLGNIWLAAGDLDRAESLYRQAISANPNHFGSYFNLGNVLKAKNLLEAALEAYKQSLQLKDPEETLGLYLILAECYHKLNQPEEGIKILRSGIKQYSNSADLYWSLIIAYQNSGLTTSAIRVAREASRLFPNDLAFKFEDNLQLPVIYLRPKEVEFYRNRFEKNLEELIQEPACYVPENIDNAVKSIGQRTNFYLQYQGKNDLELQTKYGQFIHRIMAAKYPQWVKPLPMPSLHQNDKIRVGYISPSMYNHTVGRLCIGWLSNHNSQKFEVYCYYNNTPKDQITQKFCQASHSFKQITDGLEAICEQIIADKLHVLVFLDIGMHPQMTQVAGLRLAPVQCTTWAHPITSGLPTIDYFLSSELMEPENATEHYSEKLITLPNIAFCYSKPQLTEQRKTRAKLGLRDDAIVYLSSQSVYKYLPQYDYIFAAIARRVPQAQFAFLSSQKSKSITEKFQRRIEKAFAKMGLNSEDYCTILPRLNNNEYLSLNLVSDVYLDTFSWSGGNTTLEAIACHLPIVTCPGEFMRGRHTYGILKMLGVTETIASNESEYIEIAARLGLDRHWRQTIIQNTIENNSRVFEDQTCIQALEKFYERVVRENQQ